ncbi:YkvA family protein [Intrasporangium sp. YIM S08009]|uniref:YkvA family protein n=1 Tax=Intrasporangium zincisolvens TaxID=3080018 RepID=UPI002B0586F4|nr:YkvA family protein [Intrasporangium sp. YIM S08009]
MKAASRIKLAATVASVVRAATRPGAPGVGERVQAVPRLVRATLDHAYTGTSLRRLGLVAAAVAYVASPIDLVPEAILPVIGAVDDAVVLTWVVRAFFEETDRFIAWEIGQGRHHGRGRAGATGQTVPGQAVPTSAPAPSAPPAGQPSGTTLGTAADARARLWAGEVSDSRRRDRDVTGAARGRLVGRQGAAAGSRPAPGAPSAVPGRAEGTGRVRLPEGARQAATDYVLESVRKRLER